MLPDLIQCHYVTSFRPIQTQINFISSSLFISLFMHLLFIFKDVSTSVASDSTCKDRWIWAYDGSVFCYHLIKRTSWGFWKRPDYWCNHYSLTDCCETCNKLREVIKCFVLPVNFRYSLAI